MDPSLDPDVLFEGECGLSQGVFPEDFADRDITVARSRAEPKLVSLVFTRPHGHQIVEDVVAYGGGSCHWADNTHEVYIFAARVYVNYALPVTIRDWAKTIKVMVSLGGAVLVVD